jgi:hypothetical protein
MLLFVADVAANAVIVTTIIRPPNANALNSIIIEHFGRMWNSDDGLSDIC